MIPHARAICFALGLLCGGLGAFGFVAAVLLVLAQNAGSGWRSRHVEAAEEMERWTAKQS